MAARTTTWIMPFGPRTSFPKRKETLSIKNCSSSGTFFTKAIITATITASPTSSEQASMSRTVRRNWPRRVVFLGMGRTS